MRRVSLYHICLRTTAVVMALLLVFDSGLMSPITRELSSEAQYYVATGIGIQAGVEPTELNMITAALTEKEQELAEREAALREREIDVAVGRISSDTNTSTYTLAALLFVLLVLIVLNYVLDYLRSRPVGQVRYE